MDKFSYAIGLGISQNLLSMGAREICVNDFAQAIKDVLEGNPTAITHTEAREIVNKFFTELEAKTNAENIAKGKAFLEENKKNPNIVTLPIRSTPRQEIICRKLFLRHMKNHSQSRKKNKVKE